MIDFYRGWRSMPRPLATAGIVLGLLAAAESAQSAPLPHIVYGLDPHYLYQVSFGGEPAIEDLIPSPAGGIQFESEGSVSVHITSPKRDAVQVTLPSPDSEAALSGPFPNPIRDRAELIVTAEAVGAARFRLYDPLAGRIFLDVRTPLQSGRNSVWIEIPPRIGSGIYLLRADLPHETITRKIVFIKR